MRGVDARNMNYIIDFMYFGEVNIFQKELDGFLKLAEEFELKGIHKTSLGEQDLKNYVDYDDFLPTTDLNKVKERKFENQEQSNEIFYNENEYSYNENSEMVLVGNEK